MRETLRVVGSRPAGPAAGVLMGVVAGSLVFAAWVNDLLLGIAVAGIAVALVACMLWAVPEWHRFGVGMLVGAVVATAALVAAFYVGGTLG
ncbi:hypothetical protein [Nocardioides koreensis]